MNRKLIICCTCGVLLAIVGAVLNHIDHQDKLENRTTLFNADWEFMFSTDTAWQKVDLPHDWSISGPVAETNAMGDAGGYFPDGKGVYRKTWRDYHSADANVKLALYFEGSYMHTEVYLNGQAVGTHEYGYTPFYLDITPYMKWNDNNILEVHVDNSAQKNCRWYSGSGIYRNVWLVTTQDVHFVHWSNYLNTTTIYPHLGNSNVPDSARVEVKTSVWNESHQTKDVTVRVEVSNDCYAEQSLTLEAGAIQEVTMPLIVKNPQLWSPEDPHLYTAHFSIKSDDEVVDAVDQTFGVRIISFKPANIGFNDNMSATGFILNGKHYKLFGGCIHHDNGVLGAAAFDKAEVRKVKLMKEAGFNAIRTSHNPVTEAFLNAADSLGMFVIEEAFDGWLEAKNPNDYNTLLREHWQEDISSMVSRDRNHPAIICWSIGNEILERNEHQAVEIAHDFVGLCKQIDPSRPVTQALACWGTDWTLQDSLAAEHDVIGYNYLLDWAPADHKRIPSRIIWQTESYPRDVYKNYRLLADNAFIIGDFVWTAIDYLGEASIGRYYYDGDVPGEHYQGTHFPWHGAYCGDIDITGWRKPISYYRERVFATQKAEDIHMAVNEPDGYWGTIKETAWSVWPTWDSWNWEGWEGKPVQVEVYTRYPLVRLYLNGQLIGEQKSGFDTELKAVFTLPYQPGELKAVGVLKGEEQKSVTLKTAGTPVSLRLTPDCTTLKADGQDLCYVTVEVLDKDGNICPNAEIPFTMSVEGDAKLAGAGNANMQDQDSYTDNKCQTWKGRAIIVLRSAYKSGKATLNVEPGNGLAACTPLSLDVK